MPSIAQTQKANLKAISSLGEKREEGTVEFTNIEYVLTKYAGALIAEAQINLDTTGSVSSSVLSDSIKPLDIAFAGGIYTLKITLADYYDFINKGVSGTQNKFNSPYSFKNIHPSKAMVEALQKWLASGKLKSSHRDIKTYGSYGKLEAKHNRLQPGPDRSLKSIAYAVSTNVKKRGIKPTLFWDNAIERTYPQLKKDLEQALKEDFRIVIKDINTKL